MTERKIALSIEEAADYAGIQAAIEIGEIQSWKETTLHRCV